MTSNTTLLFVAILVVIIGGGALSRNQKSRVNIQSEENKFAESVPNTTEDLTPESQKEATKTVEEDKMDQTPTQMPKVVSTENWGNYNDRSNGIKLKYPNGWSVKDRSGSTNGQKYSYKWFQSPEKKDSQDFDFGVTLIYGKSVNEYNGESTTLGKKSGVKVSDKYYIENNNQLFELEIRNQEFGPTILNTLEFTN